jgi:hypothetical protein
MHGIPDAGSADGSPAARPPDWPEPGTPLAGEEPTIELPVITEAMLAAAAADDLAPSSSGPGTARAARIGRIPTLNLRGQRSGLPRAAPPGQVVSLDSLFLESPSPARSAEARTRPDRSAAGPAQSADATSGPHQPTGAASWPDQPTVAASWPDQPADATAGPTPPTGVTAGPDLPEGTAAGPAQQAGGAAGSDSGNGGPGRRWMVGAGIAAAALLLTGATVVALTRDTQPANPGWTPPVAAAAHTVSGALGGRTDAGFDLVDGARRVTVRAADLGDRLYRITTPEGGAAVPRAEERDGRVRLRLDGDAQAVEIVLNAAVRWDLRFDGGAGSSTIDLSGGRVGGVALSGGADRIDLTLPRPDGTLGVRMSGGVSLFDLRTAERTPVRVRVGRGAGQVTLDGQNHSGVAAGQTFTPAGWAAAVDRVDVDAVAGMSALTVAPY